MDHGLSKQSALSGRALFVASNRNVHPDDYDGAKLGSVVGQTTRIAELCVEHRVSRR
jgi:hypothetical protein